MSKFRPLVWPSLWQVLQLYHWLNDRSASWNTISPRRASESVVGPPRGIVRTSRAAVGVDDLDGVGQIVGDVERLAVGGEGQLGGPAAQRHPAVPAVALEQLGRRSGRASCSTRQGRRRPIGPEDHDFVRTAATDGQALPVAADGHAVGVGRGLALGVERERGERGSEPSRATRVSRWPSTQPRSMLFRVVANPRFFMLAT